ncbi:MAG: response regulator [Cyanobacteria bacterium P01_A01_bin.83]
MIATSLLVIDDDPDFNTLVEFVLQHDTNWIILTASDGAEGLKIAKLQQPGVIFLDVVMPKLNGLDIYKLLKSHPNTCNIPIIFMTAMTRMEKIIKARITEDIKVIVKPFDIMTLANQIIIECDRYLIRNN